MTSTPPEAPSDAFSDPGDHDDPGGAAGPRTTRAEIRDLGRLRRTVADRKVAGVAGGIARHLDIDPVIIRVAFVVLVFFGGAGLLVYGACWLLVPPEGSDHAPLGLEERSRTVALMIVGVLAVAALIGDTSGAIGFPWPLAILAVVALLILSRRGRTTQGATPAAAPTYGAGSQSYATPASLAPLTPRNPRRRGPILFWFTVALVALAIGVLGIVDLAGAPIADPAYPALAVGLIGLMLMVGAFYGRAGGLILLGLLSSVVLAGSTLAGEFDGDHVRVAPISSSSVENTYDIGAGELVLDLTDVRDLDALDGRTIHLDANIGRIEVLVPAGIDVDVRADISGAGNIVLFGTEHGGFAMSASELHNGGLDVPTLTIDAQLGVGEIEVKSPETSPETSTGRTLR